MKSQESKYKELLSDWDELIETDHRPFAPTVNRLKLFLIVTPFFGFFLALWTLYLRQGTPEQRSVSRLAIVLAFMWLGGHILLEGGAIVSDTGAIPVLLASSLLTTSYFLINLTLMVRIWRNQTLWLPGISQITEKLFGKDRA